MKIASFSISIVIVNWNTCAITCDCIRSVISQTRCKSIEVIVIDNASSDNSVIELKKQFPDIILIENKKNLGFAAANNQGIKIARGNYIILLNSDTIVLDNAIEKTVSFAEEHPEAGMIGCKILNPDKSLQPSCFMYPSLLNMTLSLSYLYKVFPRNTFFAREFMGYWNHDSVKEVEVIRGCFMLTARSVIEKIGGMDSSFFIYAEETDWCYRAKKAGFKVLFTPNAEIIHLGGQSSKQIKPAMNHQLRAGILQFIRKHHSWLYYRFACFLTSLWYGIRIIPWFAMFLAMPSTRPNSLIMTKTYALGTIKSILGYKSLEFKRKN